MTPSAYIRVFVYNAHLGSGFVSKETMYVPNNNRGLVVHVYALCA